MKIKWLKSGSSGGSDATKEGDRKFLMQLSSSLWDTIKIDTEGRLTLIQSRTSSESGGICYVEGNDNQVLEKPMNREWLERLLNEI